jgi:hypothetical protein
MTGEGNRDVRFYRICGLIVGSEVSLPGVVPADPPLQEPDAMVRRGTVPMQLPNARFTGPTWQVAEQQILLRVPKVARFLVAEGREILFEPEGDSDESNWVIFLRGSALGALLHQRGGFVLHGSAAAVDGAVSLFCGGSGSGKSTLVAALSASGYPVVADDVCLVQFNGNSRPVLMPDGRRLKLWSDMIEHLGMHSQRGAAVRSGIRKYWVDSPTPPVTQPLPLRSIYFLRDEIPCVNAGISPIGLLNAVQLLRANAYKPRLVAHLGHEGT